MNMNFQENDQSEPLEKLKSELDTADAVVVGAGAGLSTSAGFTYSGERFERYFSDFEEAYEFLKAHGFKNSRPDEHIVESKSAKSCLMISPSGFSIQLTQHIRKEDR